MSFAYMALFTGDYLRDTRHLTPEEHGCYLLLLMHCWDQKGPVPMDERKQCGIVNARSTGEIESLRRVREEFFVRMEDGWYNRRMQLEVEKCENLSRVRSEAGKSGYLSKAKSKSQASAKQLPSKSQAKAKLLPLSPSPSPSTSLSPSPSPEASPPLPSWLPLETWKEYGEHRRATRAPLTRRAVILCLKKLEKLRQQGNDPKAVLEQSIVNGWRGLFEVKDAKRDGIEEWLEQSGEKEIPGDKR